MPTNKPPNMQIYRAGDLEFFAPGNRSTAHISAKLMKKTATPNATGFPVTFTDCPLIPIVEAFRQNRPMFGWVPINAVIGHL
jgi:hypothetical protein